MIEPTVLNPANGQVVHPEYQYTYDKYGDELSSTDALGNATTYTYDPFGDELSETLPMVQKESWVYNSLGQLTSYTDFDGNVADYAYDSLGRLATKTIYAFTNLSSPYDTVTYAYNINYDLQGDYHDTVADSLVGTTDREYDVNGAADRLSSPQGTISYAYDPATGWETEVSSPDPVPGTLDNDIHYAYDDAGELTSVTVNSLDDAVLSTPLVTSYTYDLDGNVVATANANGTTECVHTIGSTG